MVIRGDIISYSAYHNKQKEIKLVDAITEIDLKYSVTPLPIYIKTDWSYKHEYNSFSIDKLEQHHLH